jgi:isochorismate synthase
MIGIGATTVFTPDGPARFDELEAEWGHLVADAVLGDDGPGPALVGGLAFAPVAPEPGSVEPSPWRELPRAGLLLPRFALTIDGERQWLTTNVMVGADGHPDAKPMHLPTGPGDRPTEETAGEPSRQDVLDPSVWMTMVNEASTAVRAGEMEKVVLAREVDLRAHPGFRPEAALARLAGDYPTCTVFAFANRAMCFLGATPERLVRVQDGRVDVSCLAGTTGRGATPEEDERLGQELMDSAKNRIEHAVVGRMLRDRLAPLCEPLEMAAAPKLLKVRNVQHLYTPVVGALRDGASPLRLVEALHPTPAVGGYPTEPALRLILERERLDRGWYAGPFGWIDGRGNADFAVAIRSGLLYDPSVDGGFAGARLYAGCGIVGDSQPEAELEESRLKLRPMLAALGAAQ